MKTSEDAVHFARERLHQRRFGAAPGVFFARERIRRRFAARLAQGDNEVIPHADDTVVVRCAAGSVWITHDGDPRDVILYPGESYQADREEAMHVFALADSVIEIEFEDEAVQMH